MLDRADRDLSGAAADVADGDGALRRHAGEGALECEPSLVLPGQDPRLDLSRARKQVDELRRVSRLPTRRRNDDVDQLGAGCACVLDEAGDTLDRLGQLRRGDRAGALHVSAEPDDALAADDLQDAVTLPRSDQEADGVRADVDHRDVHRPHSHERSGCEAGTVW